jgi:hypothetical protein
MSVVVGRGAHLLGPSSGQTGRSACAAAASGCAIETSVNEAKATRARERVMIELKVIEVVL